MSKKHTIIEKNNKFKIEQSFLIMIQDDNDKFIHIVSSESGISLSDKDEYYLGQRFSLESEAIDAILNSEIEEIEDIVIQKFLRKIKI